MSAHGDPCWPLASDNIAEVDRAAANTGSAAQGVLDAAKDMTSLSDSLRNQVNGFVKKVRDND